MDNFVFAVIDTETSGFSVKGGDRIFEVGVIKIRNMQVQDNEKFVSLINPGISIGMTSKLLTGISDESIQKAQKPEQVYPQLIEFLSGVDFLIAHNAEFDKEFLEYELGHVDPFFRLPEFLCTKELSRLVYPHEKYHNLDVVLQRAGVIFEGARHRAFEDAYATAKAFLHLYINSPEKDSKKLIEKIKV